MMIFIYLTLDSGPNINNLSGTRHSNTIRLKETHRHKVFSAIILLFGNSPSSLQSVLCYQNIFWEFRPRSCRLFSAIRILFGIPPWPYKVCSAIRILFGNPPFGPVYNTTSHILNTFLNGVDVLDQFC